MKIYKDRIISNILFINKKLPFLVKKYYTPFDRYDNIHFNYLINQILYPFPNPIYGAHNVTYSDNGNKSDAWSSSFSISPCCELVVIKSENIIVI